MGSSIIKHARRTARISLNAASGAATRIRHWNDDPAESSHACNICGWHGTAFATPAHSEGAECPRCGSIARDRFLHWCWTTRVGYTREQRVLETSPRLGRRYRSRMARRVTYAASDYDESAHKAAIKLDLQDIDLPDDSLDLILTPHVLEHVPDPGRAIREMKRVLAPGGAVLLMVPMPQGRTAVPKTPEYHGDHTLVYWRFGWDLRDQLEAGGFTVACLVTQPLIDQISNAVFDTGISGPDIDEVDLLKSADVTSLTGVATGQQCDRYGFQPPAHFIIWHCSKSAG